MIPHTSRNRDNQVMGLTQPVFPRVGGEFDGENRYDAITTIDDNGKDESIMAQTQQSRHPFRH
jgi:hypothetical protein